MFGSFKAAIDPHIASTQPFVIGSPEHNRSNAVSSSSLSFVQSTEQQSPDRKRFPKSILKNDIAFF